MCVIIFLYIRLEDLKKQDVTGGSSRRLSHTQPFRYTGHYVQQNDERRDQICSQCGSIVKRLVADKLAQNISKVLCKKCIAGGNSSAKQKDSLHGEEHMAGSVENSFSCEFCKKEFPKHEYLMKHLRVHNEGKPYKCNVCGDGFSRYGDLKRHSVEHNGGKPYECKYCNRRFSEKGNLKTHCLMHTGDMPYQCHVCLKRFPHNAYLIGHLRIHTGEKPYECHICSKRFTHNSGLKTHIRVHT
jgi:KRAB domain-containing zinc finger protein